MSYLIYLVEDEDNLNRVLTSLQNEGWQVGSFHNGEAARARRLNGKASCAASGAMITGTDRVVDDLVRRLHKKMPELRLETLYGFGYRMIGS